MSPAEDGKPRFGRGADAARLAMGLADLGLEQAEGLLRRVRGALIRNDYVDMAAGARSELLARGDVVLARLGPGHEAHMEALARIAKQTRDIPDGV